MAILIYSESWNGKFRKSTYEIASYAYELAKLSSVEVAAFSFGEISVEELEKLGKYGVKKVYSFPKINKSNNDFAVRAIESISNQYNTVLFSHTYTARMIAPKLSIKINASISTNIITIPSNISPITVKRKAFSSKAIETVEINNDKVILCVSPNSYKLIENNESITIEDLNIEEETENFKINKQEKASGKISLSEAEIIVSTGRGLKGPENWNMIEELAELLNAGTACSKPVSDIGWRPHSEHVGQTGKTVAPNLYIAIGISGAIQHLAGVNSSKIIVAINTDPEAPFFKAADYGIIGDAFKVIPEMIKEIKNIEK